MYRRQEPQVWYSDVVRESRSLLRGRRREQTGIRDLAAAAVAAAASGHPALRLRGLQKTYGSGPAAVHALSDVDLEIWPGQFVVLLGPSGSGKTTLLNLVGGIEEPTSGLVEVAGRDIGSLRGETRTSYRRDNVGFVFQFFNLVPTLTAQENVEIIAELTGGGAARRSREALARVGLAEVADRFPGQMSGGQQQRVAIARAIVKEPPLLLCDEPTGSLDLATGGRSSPCSAIWPARAITPSYSSRTTPRSRRWPIGSSGCIRGPSPATRRWRRR